MSNFDENQIDKRLRLLADCQAKGQQPPPELTPGAIAAHYGVTTQYVLNKLNERRKPKDQPA